MTMLWWTAFAVSGLIYLLFVSKAIKGITRLAANQLMAIPDVIPKPLSVSVIISARNEEFWIGPTLDSLLDQTLVNDGSFYEIIVVDDRSSDDTSEAVRKYAAEHTQIRLINQRYVPKGVSPKKSALTAGIAGSKGEIILMTDADCRHNPEWARKLGDAVAYNEGMVIGQARFSARPFDPLWVRLQSLDFAVQGVLSAGLVSAKSPFNCSGASLGFTKKSFYKVNGWTGIEEFISGDDELLMRKFHAAGIPVSASWNKECVVSTRSPDSFGEMWNQRLRWGSKTLHYPTNQKTILSFIFAFYLLLALSPVLIWAGLSLFPPLIGMLSKMIVDLTLLNAARPLYGDNPTKTEFVLAELLHPPLITILAVMGAFGTFEWKGTTYTTRSSQ